MKNIFVTLLSFSAAMAGATKDGRMLVVKEKVSGNEMYCPEESENTQKRAVAAIMYAYDEYIGTGVAISTRQVIVAADTIKNHVDKMKNLYDLGAKIMNEHYYAIHVFLPRNANDEHDFTYADIAVMTTIRDIAHYLPEYYMVEDPIDYAFARDTTTLMLLTESMGEDDEVWALPLLMDCRGKYCTNDISEPDSNKIICAAPANNYSMIDIENVDSGSPLFFNDKLLGIVSRRHCPRKEENIIFTCLLGNQHFVSRGVKAGNRFLEENFLL